MAEGRFELSESGPRVHTVLKHYQAAFHMGMSFLRASHYFNSGNIAMDKMVNSLM